MTAKKEYDLEAHRWKMPRDYAGAEWPAYYVAAGRSRDSDALEESNFRVTLKKLGGESGHEGDRYDGEPVIVIRERHWAVGWVEWIGVHESNKTGLEILGQLAQARENYPVLDDEDFSTEERERAMLGLTNCYDLTKEDAERVAEWCENNGWVLEGEDYASKGIEEAKAALGLA